MNTGCFTLQKINFFTKNAFIPTKKTFFNDRIWLDRDFEICISYNVSWMIFAFFIILFLLDVLSSTNLPSPPKQNWGMRSLFEMEPRRIKRSEFFHSEVKVCPQESVRDVIASHQAYYTLRGKPEHLKHNQLTITTSSSDQNWFLLQHWMKLNTFLNCQFVRRPYGRRSGSFWTEFPAVPSIRNGFRRASTSLCVFLIWPWTSAILRNT